MQKGKNINVDFKETSFGKKAWEFNIENTKKEAGRYSDIITINTDSPIMKELKIRVYGDISNKKI
jgi:hypothetical protein